MREEHYASLEERKFKTIAQVHINRDASRHHHLSLTRTSHDRCHPNPE
jgi:hypothetical protein